ncbi:MAG TPA: phosphoenolpyruvate carboxykinase (ATP) [Panacibacter sp.]|nr:phosphoenolpyruvate carboxykinase (ATP) [Panacibacter sp.]HNP44927.1 phosphoenolpyruvate carboxykinase (ATP) [Panacibacter sp.]
MILVKTNFPKKQLQQLGLNYDNVHYQLSPNVLTEQTLLRKEGVLNSSGALCINTGEFTGRCPQDKFTVRDTITENNIHWNNFNLPIDEKYFFQLKEKMLGYLNCKNDLWVRDCYACTEPAYRLNIRVINENPWSNLFAYNMFLRPKEDDLENFVPEWTILQAPGFSADPSTDGTRAHNFAIISFTHKTILIGGTGYTGEMKKGIFTVLNYILPQNKQVLSMHCSANVGRNGDVAIFFGLSGTGKTTLSADPHRKLIGDDEHGWNNDSVFNFEGGCYAKCIDLDEEKEPEIFHAIRPGALVENVMFFDGTDEIDFAGKKITENTRVSYPLHFIGNAVKNEPCKNPKNIFFLTCDAYGVLPPISKLSAGQAMYQFISGYTAKVAGTEEGVKEPKATFSACFGAPFLPLHPGKYAEMLGKKIKDQNVKVWMINTGWIGGGYGVGTRIKLRFTRSMINAVLNNQLDHVEFEEHPVFGVMVPKTCPDVPAVLLKPRDTWTRKSDYDQQANMLASLFIKNFEQYAECISPEILEAAPKPGSL